MADNNNIRDIYDALSRKSSGNIMPYEDFESMLISDESKRRDVYNALSKGGNMIPFDKFNEGIMGSVQQPSQQPVQPQASEAATPVSEPVQPIQQTPQVQQPAQPQQNDTAVQTLASGGYMPRSMVPSSKEEWDEMNRQAQEVRNERQAALEAAQQKAAGIDKDAIKEKRDTAREKKNRNFFRTLGAAYASQIGGVTDLEGDIEKENWNQLKEASEQYYDNKVISDYLGDALDVINQVEKVDKKGHFNLGQGFIDDAKDLSTWDMGYSDVLNGLTIKELVEKAEAGEPLSALEQDVLDAVGFAQYVQDELGSQVGTSYKVGQSLPQSGGFMASLMLNPASGIGRQAGVAAMRKYGKKALARAARYGGDALEMGIATLTSGGGRTAAEMLEKLNGTAAYDTDIEGGYNGYSGQQNQEENLWKAAWQSFASQYVENWSEAVGEYFFTFDDILRTLTNGKFKVKSIDTLEDWLQASKKEKWGSRLADFRRRTKFDGIVGEILEEEVGNMVGPFLEHIGDNEYWKQVGKDLQSTMDVAGVFGNPEQARENQLVTIMSCALMSGFLSGIQSPSMKKAIDLDRQVNRAAREGRKVMGEERWAELQNRIDSSTPDEMTHIIKDMMQAARTSEQAEAELEPAFRYVLAELARQEYHSTVQQAKDEMSETERNLINAYNTGFTASRTATPMYFRGIRRDLLISRDDVEYYDATHPGANLKEITDRLVEADDATREQILQGMPSDMRELAEDYLGSYERFRGLYDGFTDAADADEMDFYDSIRPAIVDGTVTTATTADGRDVFVTSNDGKIAYIIDNATGERKEAYPADQLSTIQTVSVDELMDEYEKTVEDNWRRTLTNYTEHNEQTQQPQLGMVIGDGDETVIITDIGDGWATIQEATTDKDGNTVPKPDGKSRDVSFDYLLSLQDDIYDNRDRLEGKEIPSTLPLRREADDTADSDMRDRIQQWSAATGVPVKVIDRVEDIDNSQVLEALSKGVKVAGWYNTSTGEVCFYMPNVKDMSEVDKTFIHEVVGHKGMRLLMGEQEYNALCGRVWNELMTDRAKAWCVSRLSNAERTQEETEIAAADEYIAYLAEQMELDPNEETRSLWERFVEMIREFLIRHNLGGDITNEDLSNMLMASLANYRKNARGEQAQTQEAPAAEEQTQQPSALASIPSITNEKTGETDYLWSQASDIKTALDAMREAGYDDDVIRDYANDMIASLEAEAKKLGKPKAGTTMAQRQQMKADLAENERQRLFWQAISDAMTLREQAEEEAARQQQMEAQAEQEAIDAYGSDFSDVDDALNQVIDEMDFESMVRYYAAHAKYIWADSDHGTKGFASHMFAARGNKRSERLANIGWLANRDKGGYYPEEVAERIFADLPESIKQGHDEMETLDIIISTIQSANHPATVVRDMYAELIRKQQEAELREQQRLQEEEERQQDAYARDHGFANYREMLTFEELWASGEDIVEIPAEQLENYYNTLYGTDTDAGAGTESQGVVQQPAGQNEDNSGSDTLVQAEGPDSGSIGNGTAGAETGADTVLPGSEGQETGVTTEDEISEEEKAKAREWLKGTQKEWRDKPLSTLAEVKWFLNWINYKGSTSKVLTDDEGNKFVKYQANGSVTPNIYLGKTTPREIFKQFLLYDNIMEVNIPNDIQAEFEIERLESKRASDDAWAEDREQVKKLLKEAGIPFYDVIDSERGSRIVFTDRKNDNGNYLDYMDVSDADQAKEDIEYIRNKAEQFKPEERETPKDKQNAEVRQIPEDAVYSVAPRLSAYIDGNGDRIVSVSTSGERGFNLIVDESGVVRNGAEGTYNGFTLEQIFGQEIANEITAAYSALKGSGEDRFFKENVSYLGRVDNNGLDIILSKPKRDKNERPLIIGPEPLNKGEKWNNTGEPEKFKTGKKHDSHDSYFKLGNKTYGLTTAEAGTIEVLAEEYGSLTALWNAYEAGQVLLDTNEAAAVKAQISYAEKNRKNDGNTLFREANDRASLMGAHNITAENLKNILKRGGLANPSMAVVNTDNHIHTNYGEISLIPYASHLDASQYPGVITYSGDAYTPNYPHVVHELTDKGEKKIWDMAERIGDGNKEVERFVQNNLSNHAQDNGTHLTFEYAFEHGLNPEVVYEQPLYSKEEYDRLHAIVGDKSANELTREEKDKVLDILIADKQKSVDEHIERLKSGKKGKFTDKLLATLAHRVEDYRKDITYEDGEIAFSTLDNYIYRVNEAEYLRQHPRIDSYKTRDRALQQISEAGLNDDYWNWVEDLFTDEEWPEKIFVGYTPSGTRRYVPNTLENASRLMNKEPENNAEDWHGYNATRSLMLKKMRTLSDIRKYKDLLTAEEDYHDQAEKMSDEWAGLVGELSDMQKISDNPFSNMDYAEARIQEAMLKSNPIAHLNKEYGYHIDKDSDFGKRLLDAIFAMESAPAKYFETKFKRPVYLNEFKTAIVPDNLDKELKDRLAQAGINVVDYTHNDLEDRINKTRQATEGDTDVRFRVANENQAVFVSNAAKAVGSIKQEKATPDQWLAMIQKQGGIKAGEDKWLGLSQWLQDKKAEGVKTLAKQEIEEFVDTNKIQIEEQRYSEAPSDYDRAVEEEYPGWNEAFYPDVYDGMAGEQLEWNIRDLTKAVELFNNNNSIALHIDIDEDGEIPDSAYDEIQDWAKQAFDELPLEERGINSTRLGYTTEGLNNKREIALWIPDIEPWNEGDNIHFGDAGSGRAIAWIRFGDARGEVVKTPVDRHVEDFDEPVVNANHNLLYYPKGSDRYHTKEYVVYGELRSGEEKYVVMVNDGNKQIGPFDTLDDAKEALNIWYNTYPKYKTSSDRILVIDEIQSKRHQEGRERGYKGQFSQTELDQAREEAHNYSNELYKKYGKPGEDFLAKATKEEKARFEELNSRVSALTRLRSSGIPDAPFEKNWQELAMKRMLRLAAEEGYDKVAWTTGEQQSERYNIGGYLSSIKRLESNDINELQFTLNLNGDHSQYIVTDNNGHVIRSLVSEFRDRDLSDIIGKDLADKTLALKENEELDTDDITISNSGMATFYDKMLVNFMNKYGKQWGVKVENVDIPGISEGNWENAGNGLTMHSINVTDQMKKDVMEGQTMFRIGDNEKTHEMNDKQKQPGEDYEIEDEVRFRLSKNNRRTIESWLNKRTDLGEGERQSTLNYIDSLDDSKTQLATGWWFAKGAIRLPEDMPKVEQAVAVSTVAKVDPLNYSSPMELINAHAGIKVKEKPINPDEVSTLHKVKQIPGTDIVVYDVDDSEESRQNMRRIIDTHFGKESSPWCLLQGDGEGNLTEQSREYWNYYNSYPKQVAFKNGKLLAFSANRGSVRWWDRMDESHVGIPVEGKIPNDELGRSGVIEYDPADGEATVVRDMWRGNPDNGPFETYYDTGQLRKRSTRKDTFDVGPVEVWHRNGQKAAEFINNELGNTEGGFKTWHPNGQLQTTGTMANGRPVGVHETYFDNGQLEMKSVYPDEWRGNQHPIEPRERFYPNGQIRSIEPYDKDGIKNGTETEWFEDGKKEVEVEYVNNEPKRATRWFQNGDLESTRHWDENGYKTGVWEKYRWDWDKKKSVPLVRITYRNGAKNGIYEEYYSNGQMKMQTNFKDGDAEGLVETWNEDGKMFLRYVQKDRKEIGQEYYDYDKNEVVQMYTIRDGAGWVHNYVRRLPMEGYKPLTEEELSTYPDWAKEEIMSDPTMFRVVDDPLLIETLEAGKKQKGYRTVAVGEDGILGSPMAGSLGKKGSNSVKTSRFELGKWEQAEENPQMATEYGKVNLIKPNGRGSVGGVDYNPYIHIRPTSVNKQFTQAWSRPELAYIETEYPERELTSGYKADRAKLPVGRHAWNGGELILSRWDKPARIVPWEEVADEWAKEFKDNGVTFDIVSPHMLDILVDKGVKILPPKKAAGKAAMNAYKKWLGERGPEGGDKIRMYIADEALQVLDAYENGEGLGSYLDLVDSIENSDVLMEDKTLSGLVKEYRTLQDIDRREGRRDYTGGEMDDMVEGDIIPRLRRLADGDTRFRVTPEQDAEYRKAYEEGDAEKAAQMVKDAFKAMYPNTKVVDEKGEPMVVYHGTPHYRFNAFAEPGSNLQGLIWTAVNKKYAETYAASDKEVRESEEEFGDANVPQKDGIYKLLVNIKNPVELGNIDDSVGSDTWDAIAKKFGLTPKELFDRIGWNGSRYETSIDQDDAIYELTREGRFVRLLKENGYDGVTAREGGPGVGGTFKTYGAVSGNQVKSAEPFTFDDNGELIPLSERFNPENNDIRFREAEQGSLFTPEEMNGGVGSSQRNITFAGNSNNNERTQSDVQRQGDNNGAQDAGRREAATSRKAGEIIKPLRKLKEGETCLVERKMTEDKNFSFIGPDKIETSADVAYIFKELENKAIENAFMVFQGEEGTPAYVLHVGMGNVTASSVDLGPIIPMVDSIKPKKIWLVHNHPSGQLKPSRQDNGLLQAVRSMIGVYAPEVAVPPGIIIDTTRGVYGEFDGYGVDDVLYELEASDVERKAKYPVYKFDEQAFSKDYVPDNLNTIRHSGDVAKFVATHRLGERSKINILVLNTGSQIVGNFFSDVASLDNSDDALRLARECSRYMTATDGAAVIVFGTGIPDLRTDEKRGRAVKILNQALLQMDTRLLDVQSIDKNDPNMDYPTYYSYVEHGAMEEMPEYGDVRMRVSDGIEDRRENESPREFVRRMQIEYRKRFNEVAPMIVLPEQKLSKPEIKVRLGLSPYANINKVYEAYEDLFKEGKVDALGWNLNSLGINKTIIFAKEDQAKARTALTTMLHENVHAVISESTPDERSKAAAAILQWSDGYYGKDPKDNWIRRYYNKWQSDSRTDEDNELIAYVLGFDIEDGIDRQRAAEYVGGFESLRGYFDNILNKIHKEDGNREGTGRSDAGQGRVGEKGPGTSAGEVTEKETSLKQAEKATDTNPTEGQKEAGNYKHGHTRQFGMDLSIENPEGSTRSGVDPDGNAWSQVMKNTYGYIRGTLGRDKDHIDFFLGPNLNSDKIFVVDQRDIKTGAFDEHKVMLGFDDIEQARDAYNSNYDEGWQGLGDITETSLDNFKEWAFRDGRRVQPFGGNVRFRVRDEQEYERIENTLGVAAARYERAMDNMGKRLTEVMQDSMKSVDELQKAVAEESGKPIRDYENAYWAAIQYSSRNKAMQEAYHKMFYRPLMDEVAKLVRGQGDLEAAMDELNAYLLAKHGLERNEVFARRDAKKEYEEYINQHPKGTRTEDDFYLQNRRRDYSGLTALMEEKNVTAAEGLAQALVDNYEKNHDTAELWKRINAATKETLRTSVQGGVLSQEKYQELLTMFQNYVPLRGFDETTSDDIYGYYGTVNSPYNTAIKAAKGRRSLADSPLATIANIADSEIMRANRNRIYNAALNLAENHHTRLMSVSEVLYERDPQTGQWHISLPQFDKNDTPEDVAQKMAAHRTWFAQQVLADPANYRTQKEMANVPYKVISKSALSEHQVMAMRDGKQYIITINANPRAAQALAGKTNPDSSPALQWLAPFNRFLASVFTQYNPSFVLANLTRDGIYTNAMVWAKESPKYAKDYNKNWGRSLANMASLLSKYKKGTLDDNVPIERYFKEFIDNGGETGYTQLRSVKDYKKIMNRELKDVTSLSPTAAGRKVMSVIGDAVDNMNRWAEGVSRFAAYMTSREQGRSVTRSIEDAKEISVNFNKKGSGVAAMTDKDAESKLLMNVARASQLGRELFVFFNAGVQGMANAGGVVKNNPKKATALMTGLFLAGAALAMMNGGDGDDDDEKDYYNLPEYIRRSNICIKVGKHWLTIPLPIELRALYGLGELAYSVMSGNEYYEGKELAYEAASQLSQILPIDFLEGNQGTMAFIPSGAKPVVEAYWLNQDWTGAPVYNESPFNEFDPEWRKAYKSTSPALVAATRALSNMTGGNVGRPGAINLNPARIEHLFEGYLGGVGTILNQAYKTAGMAWDEDLREMRNVPIVSRFIKDADDRAAVRAENSRYHKVSDYVDEVMNEDRRLRQIIAEKEVTGYDYDEEVVKDAEKRLNELRESKEWEFVQEWRALDKGRTRAREGRDEEAFNSITKQMNDLYRQYRKKK